MHIIHAHDVKFTCDLRNLLRGMNALYYASFNEEIFEKVEDI